MSINDKNYQYKADGAGVVNPTGNITPLNPVMPKEKPKEIFAGITKAQAEEYGLIDEYVKANTDGVDGISQEEYETYNKNNKQKDDAYSDLTASQTTESIDDENQTQQTSRSCSNYVQAKPIELVKLEILRSNMIEAEKVNRVILPDAELAKSTKTYCDYAQTLIRMNKRAEIEKQIEDLYNKESTEESQQKLYNLIYSLEEFKISDTDDDGVLTQKELINYIQNRNTSLEKIRYNQVENTRDEIDTISSSGKRQLIDSEYELINSEGEPVGSTKIKDENGSEKIINYAERKLLGATYIVQNGDTLADIAKDFNIPLTTLWMNNKDIIGNDLNSLKTGTKLKISGFQSGVESEERIEYETKTIQIFMSDKSYDEKIREYSKLKEQYTKTPILFEGMTKEQAYSAGDDVKELFDKYSNKGHVLNKQAFLAYKRSLTQIDEKEFLDLLKTFNDNDTLPSNFNTFTEILLPTMIDTSSIQTKTATYQRISNEIQASLQNLEGLSFEEIKLKSKELVNHIKEDCKNEINNNGKTLSGHIARLKAGNFTKFEQQAGLSKDIPLTEEQLRKYAIAATKAEYIMPIIEAAKSAIESHDDNRIIVLLGQLGQEFFELPDVVLVIQTYGLEAVSEDIKQAFGNMLAQESNLNGTSEEVQASFGIALAKTGNTEAVQTFMNRVKEVCNNYEELTEHIQSAVNNFPPAIKETITELLNNMLNTYTSQEKINNTSNDKNNSSQISENGQDTNLSYSNDEVQIISYSQENSAHNIRTQSENLLREIGITDVSKEQQDTNQAVHKLARESEGIPQLTYSKPRVDKLKKEQVFDIIAKNYEQIPDALKVHIDNYFKQMPAQVLIDVMLDNEKMQTFMLKHKFVKMDDIVNYVRKHPQLMEKGNKQISDSLKEQLKDFAKERKLDDIHIETNKS